MAERTISPGLRYVLELGPIALFFLGYTMFKDRLFIVGGEEYSGFIAVTAGFIPLCLAAIFIHWRLTGRVSRMQAVTALLVTVFGGLSIWFNDERFFKIKPTIIYLLFAGILGAGLLKNRSALQYALESAMPLTRDGWMVLTRRTMVFCLCLAVANELIWRLMSTDSWVLFKTFGLPGVTLLFFVSQTLLLQGHFIDQEQPAGDKPT
ncbi:MAG: septation protein IspZ [Rhodobacteraceae bacterium]|nr:septation protein IspZ [Paracoccaceae bacterium]